ncbi:carbon-nitrogen hydrolase family protein [Vibrio sp. SCSIO 43135]|uniref:carbon-nitrogen hydrolase family protein n=1 Tax=Vibrio sp. SCSIO 43135 TaxID=2819096 RepID=UPI0020755175|nr:carbon-nitrogen hydrolase family protein [Vibrio sp. SCSIO 43135]USD41512.1 carbon-nitrogen hydrolase family protein [Vibrio sp. SCSIO 43135]
MESVGLIQMTSGPEPLQNIAYIEQEVTRLAEQGAKLIVTPENALVFGNKQDYHLCAEPLGSGELQDRLSQLAANNKIWLLVGSMPIATLNGVTTTSLLFNPDGRLTAHYDKLHMFDVDVEDGHKRYRESETFSAGNQVVTAETSLGILGLSICYDVRFPHLYSELVQKGAQILIVPAAFTAVTGKAHWETLLRARAIETQAWVIAVNQTGVHPCGRETWGHSMVISPWGEVILSLAGETASAITEIDLAIVEDIRKNMPVGQHTRFENTFKTKSRI